MTYVLHSQQSECRFLQVGTGRRGKKVTKNDNKTITETIRFHLNEAPAEHLPPGTRLVLLLLLPLPPHAAAAAAAAASSCFAASSCCYCCLLLPMPSPADCWWYFSWVVMLCKILFAVLYIYICKTITKNKNDNLKRDKHKLIGFFHNLRWS